MESKNPEAVKTVKENRKEKNVLHEAIQQGRKLDLLLAESDRQSERLRELEDSKLQVHKRKPCKSKNN